LLWWEGSINVPLLHIGTPVPLLPPAHSTTLAPGVGVAGSGEDGNACVVGLWLRETLRQLVRPWWPWHPLAASLLL
jgi:hypothetical protein